MKISMAIAVMMFAVAGHTGKAEAAPFTQVSNRSAQLGAVVLNSAVNRRIVLERRPQKQTTIEVF